MISLILSSSTTPREFIHQEQIGSRGPCEPDMGVLVTQPPNRAEVPLHELTRCRKSEVRSRLVADTMVIRAISGKKNKPMQARNHPDCRNMIDREVETLSTARVYRTGPK